MPALCRTSPRRVRHLCWFGLGWLLAATLWAADAGESGPWPELRVPSGPAAETLPELVRQTGLQVFYQSDTVAGVETRRVRGKMPGPDALRQMLAGTRLEAVPDSASGAFVVVARKNGPRGSAGANPLTPAPSEPPMKSKPTLLRSVSRAFVALGFAAAGDLDAQTAPPPPPGQEAVVTLSPFSITAGRDEGYTATQSLAGGRLATSLKDTGAAITVLTREFLDDIAANNFLEAADWAPNSNSVYSASGPQIFNDYQVNFRSLGAGFQSRNYFRWYVNSDVYNTSRIDFARGPNSVVFGDSGVGGIANVSSKRAVNAEINELSYRWNSFDGNRVSLDVNRAVSDKLYVRVAGLFDHSDDWVDAQRTDREGVYLTATYRLTPTTELRGEYEWGVVDRVVGFFPFDNFSSWDGTTTVSAPLTTGNFTGGLSRYTADQLTWTPGSPSLGIVNWRNWGRTSGTVRQMLTTPFELAPANAPTVDRLSRSYQSPDAVVHQPYRVGAFFLEHQVGDQLFLEVAGNTQKQEREVIQHFAQAVTIDVNRFLPSGGANPNFGKRYTEDRRRQQNQSNELYEYRASAAYLLKHDWFEQRVLVSAGQRWDTFFISDHELVRTNGTDLRLNQAANRINVRTYEDALDAGLGLPAPSGDPSGIQSKYAQLSGRYNDNELTYLQAAASGSWLKSGRLKTVVAARRDFLNVERADQVLDPVTFEWARYAGETRDPKVNVTTFTGSAVFEVTDNINAFVNFAESFQPATAAVSIDGGAIPPLDSEGIDLGVKFSLFSGRVNGSLSYYISEETNRRTTGSATEINAIWDDLNSSNEVTAGYNDTFSQEGKGVELDLTANLTKNWRLLFNIAFPQAKQLDGYATTIAYFNQNVAAWRAGAAAQTDPAIATRINNNIAAIETRIASFAQGRDLNGAYDYTANLYSNYTISTGRLKGLGIGGGVQLRGKRLITNRPSSAFDYVYADSYELVTAALSYRMRLWDNPLRLQLNVSNLFDKELVQPTRYSNYTVNGVTQYVADRYYIQPPRRFTMTATYEF